MPPIPLPAKAIEQARRELDVDLVVKAATDGGFRAPEATIGMYEEAVLPAVIAALNAVDEAWVLPKVLGVTVDELRQAMLPLAAERGLDFDAADELLPEALHCSLLLRGGNPERFQGGRRWLAVALRAYADLIEEL